MEWMSINPPIQVSTTDRFESEVRQLGKRYRRIRHRSEAYET